MRTHTSTSPPLPANSDCPPADFLAFFKRERHPLKSFEVAFRQFGWSAMEAPVAFLRRINAQA